MSPIKTLSALVLFAVFVLGPAVYVQAREAITRRKKASFYGEGYRGKLMANGHPYDPDGYTCACWDWPLGTGLLVEHGGQGLVFKLPDHGPDKPPGRPSFLSE